MNNNLEEELNQSEVLKNPEEIKTFSSEKAEVISEVENKSDEVVSEGNNILNKISDISEAEKGELSLIQGEILELKEKTDKEIENIDIDEKNEAEFLLGFDNQMKPGESNEEFMNRLLQRIKLVEREKEETNDKKISGISLKKKLSDYDLFNSPKWRSDVEAATSVILEKEKTGQSEQLNEAKNEEVFNLLKSEVSTSSNWASSSADYYNSQKYYGETNQSRSFFPRHFKKHDDYPYSISLFGVGLADSEIANEYLSLKVNDKKICLLGGGESVQDLVESDNPRPKKIVNIDPYLGTESVDRGKNKNYKGLLFKADDPSLSEKLEEEGLEKFDEIWASYSVPFYNKNPEEIKNLLNNIQNLLDKNGNCRIVPVTTQDSECAQALINEVEKIKDSKKFNLHLTDKTLIIHKL